jgi:DNA-binding transcriptional ArsR family regulator
LVALQSTLTIAAVARVIPEDIARLFAEQLDALLRYLSNHYLNKEGVPAGELSELAPVRATPRPVSKSSSAPQRQRRVNIPAGDISTDAYLVYSQLTDRAERIKTVLEAKPEATIKDIAEVITDVSEKTIQRELNSLIEKGQVSREGERRWSRYSVVK